MEFKKNDRVTVTIEDMGSDGEGIGKVDGFTLFIKDAVIGDHDRRTCRQYGWYGAGRCDGCKI